jgi:kynurenine formamidase
VVDYNKWDGFRGPYWTRTHIIDSHTGTHYDSPQHFIPPPGFDNDTYTPFAKEMLAQYEAKYGPRATTEINNDKVPVNQMVGPLRVVDVTHLVGTVPKDQWLTYGGPDITVADVQKHEAKYGPIKAGDIVVFMSKHDDKYYKTFAEMGGSDTCVKAQIDGKAEGWPTPTPECVAYLFDKGVKCLGIDAPSMGDGPVGKKAIFTHWMGLGHEMIYIEYMCNVGAVPADGSAFLAWLPCKTVGASGDIGRAIAITGPIAKDLNAAALAGGKVVDLTTPISPDLPGTWPGHFPMKVQIVNIWGPGGPWKSEFKIVDEHVGTHFDAPMHFIPLPGFKNSQYSSSFVRDLAKEYEAKYGPIARSTVTNDKVPVDQFCGPLKVVEVGQLEGTAGPGKSPVITMKEIQAFESQYGPIKAGDVVLFRSGYDDKYYSQGDRCVKDALTGKAEGWPSPNVEAVKYLAEKGVRNVVTDGPSMGATTGREAIMTHWMGLGKGMIYTEMVMNVGDLPNTGAFFIFCCPKTEGGSGMIGRAMAILP